MRDMYMPGKTAWCTTQGEYRFFFVSFLSTNYLLSYSCFLVCARYIAIKQWCISHSNTTSPAIIPTYSRVLSAIKKALQDLVEEY